MTRVTGLDIKTLFLGLSPWPEGHGAATLFYFSDAFKFQIIDSFTVFLMFFDESKYLHSKNYLYAIV